MNGEIQTHDGWMSGVNATFVLCPPPPFIAYFDTSLERVLGQDRNSRLHDIKRLLQDIWKMSEIGETLRTILQNLIKFVPKMQKNNSCDLKTQNDKLFLVKIEKLPIFIRKRNIFVYYLGQIGIDVKEDFCLRHVQGYISE